MKPYSRICLAAIFLFCSSLAVGLTIDVKTKLAEKPMLTACKVGLIYYLGQNGITVKETGEDYAVWLENVQRAQKGDEITVSVELHLTGPSFVTQGPSLERVTVEFHYPAELNLLQSKVKELVSNNQFSQMVAELKKSARDQTEVSIVEGITGGEALYRALNELLKGRGYRVKS